MRDADAPLRRHARAMRRDATPAERTLWRMLREAFPSARFRRQHPIPPGIADFASIPHRLVIEVDGWTHDDAAADAARDAALEAQGWRVLRVSNTDVLRNPEGVLEAIGAALAVPLPARALPPP